MPEFFLELFSEEIPARMQSESTEAIRWAVEASLAKIGATDFKAAYGPRRQAVWGHVSEITERNFVEIRGPKEGSSESAIFGFSRKHNVEPENLALESGYWWFRQNVEPVRAIDHVKTSLESVLTSNFWPKTMRWGQSGGFSWIRPLRRIVCLLDSETVPIKLGPITASNETEGHRFLSPGAVTVSSVIDWLNKLLARHVIADQTQRRELISSGLTRQALALGLKLSDDPLLLDEVTGLVEWPVPLIGKIDENFMDLPAEVRELSMRVNQRYFALRHPDGSSASYFAFVSNIEAVDGGAAIIAGNERVLRARLSDARHFWDLDLKTPLDQLLPKLDKITFHAKIGSQADRVKRISALARKIAEILGADAETATQAEWAGKLSKADLVTGMVGEFPELQGVMGGYYAEKNPRGWNGSVVGPAIASQYQPRGPSDSVPSTVVGASVALAEKLDTLIEFFRINEKPTGSGDPYALRRAALGIIRIILENKFDLRLRACVENEELLKFIFERLQVKLRSEGKRFDVLDAVLSQNDDDNLVRVMKRVNAISHFIQTKEGNNLLVAYRRAANILRIEDARDGPHVPLEIYGSMPTPQEEDLQDQLNFVERETLDDFERGNFSQALASLANLRTAVDNFFDAVTINAEWPQTRVNRLGLLARLRDIVNQIADFSKIEG
jgi:glycyl-tRNA synthetase beta chain